MNGSSYSTQTAKEALLNYIISTLSRSLLLTHTSTALGITPQPVAVVLELSHFLLPLLLAALLPFKIMGTCLLHLHKQEGVVPTALLPQGQRSMTTTTIPLLLLPPLPLLLPPPNLRLSI